jgi:hypothetical protein
VLFRSKNIIKNYLNYIIRTYPITPEFLYNIENIQPFEETFMGSNYKSYKHKYYLMKMKGNVTNIKQFDNTEVSKIEWKTYKECIECIRPYNLEKKALIQNIYNCLISCKLA